MKTKINAAGFGKNRVPRKRKKEFKKCGLYKLIERLNYMKNFGRYTRYKNYKSLYETL